MQLTVDPLRNDIEVQRGYEHGRIRFTRRWTGHLMAALLARSQVNACLEFSEFESLAAAHGQRTRFTRTTMQRLIRELESSFQHPLLVGVELQFSPGDMCNGPWRLRLPEGASWNTKGQARQRPLEPGYGNRGAWASPLVTERFDLTLMHQFLEQMMVADELHRHNDHLAAHEVLGRVRDMRLTRETHQFVQLKDAFVLKHQGLYEPARQECLDLLRQSDAAETVALPQLTSMATFLLDRIRYDENPALNYTALRAQAAPPAPIHAPDRIVMAEWHNLQGLTHRRALLASPAEQHSALHELAMTHFESAVLLRLMAQDTAKVPDVLFNITFHLQETLAHGLSTLADVCLWYRLTTQFDHRYNLMGATAWDYLFMGKLWLSNHAELMQMSRTPSMQQLVNSALILDNLHPWQPQFYLEAVKRCQTAGEPRPLAIAHWMCREHAAQNPDGPLLTGVSHRHLMRLLDEHPGLTEQLTREGYSLSPSQSIPG